MEKYLFNPLRAPSDEGRPILINRLEGRPPWVDVWKNWWGGATIGRPHLGAALEAKKTLNRARYLSKKCKEHDSLIELNNLYHGETENCRQAVHQVLQTDPTNVDIVFETSGTSAISLVRHSIDFNEDENIITSDENGNLIFPTLMGGDPYSSSASAFTENTRLFSRHKQHIHKNHQSIGLKKIRQMSDNEEWKSNEQIINELLSSIDNKTRMIVLPQVTKTGRLLPVKKMGDLIKEINMARDRKIIYVIDAIQALGRTDAESIFDPMNYCDFFICSSSKALGGILIASAIVAKKLSWETSILTLLNSPYEGHLRYYQFDQDRFPLVYEKLSKKEGQEAISLPEITSFRICLESMFERGGGKNYSERRKNIVEKTKQQRDIIINELQQVNGLTIIEGNDSSPVVPSIISFIINNPSLSAFQIKKLIQDSPDSVILSANVGKIMRISIPEYFDIPDPKKYYQKN